MSEPLNHATTTASPPSSSFFTRVLLPIILLLAVAISMKVIGQLRGDYPTRILLDTGIAIVLAVSLNIVNGYTGQFSIGHAAFMAIGGYVGGFVSYYLMLSHFGWGYADESAAFDRIFRWTGNEHPKIAIWLADLYPQHWIMAASCLIGGIVAAACGYIVGLPSLRLRGDYLAIVTLGFGEIVRVLFQQTNRQIYTVDELRAAKFKEVFLPPAVGGAAGFTDIPKVTDLFWLYLFAGLTVLFAYRLKQSSYGRALLSIREDEIAAQAMGVNVTKYKVRAFVFAAFFAGVAGSLYVHQPGTTLRPIDAGFQRSFDVVIMVVLGGLGSISGAILAAILITFVQAGLLALNDVAIFGTHLNLLPYRMPAFALLLILTMIFRPSGLFGVREIWDVWPFKRRRVN